MFPPLTALPAFYAQRSVCRVPIAYNRLPESLSQYPIAFDIRVLADRNTSSPSAKIVKKTKMSTRVDETVLWDSTVYDTTAETTSLNEYSHAHHHRTHHHHTPDSSPGYPVSLDSDSDASSSSGVTADVPSPAASNDGRIA